MTDSSGSCLERKPLLSCPLLFSLSIGKFLSVGLELRDVRIGIACGKILIRRRRSAGVALIIRIYLTLSWKSPLIFAAQRNATICFLSLLFSCDNTGSLNNCRQRGERDTSTRARSHTHYYTRVYYNNNYYYIIVMWCIPYSCNDGAYLSHRGY